MRSFILSLAMFSCSLHLVAQAPLSAQTPPPQTARQALIEMFFGEKSDHLEKHLPDVTRRSFKKMDTGNGQNLLTTFSMIAAQVKAGGTAVQTFDTGPTILKMEDPKNSGSQEIEITVERDDLSGDEDDIELAPHVSRNGKEESLPFIPRFVFAMKMDQDVWRLNEINASVRLPLADPDFLKSIEDRQRAENEQMNIWAIHSVLNAQTAYKTANGAYACDLALLGKPNKQASGGPATYLMDPQLTSGKRNGYVFVISGCDGSHYKIVGEPAAPDSGQRAFCSDESGTIRASADGKATSCVRSGDPVDETGLHGAATGLAVID